MKPLDRFLQRWRIRKAVPFVRDGDRLLDVGCFDRTLIDGVAGRIRSAVGVDPELESGEEGRFRWMRGMFPDDVKLDDGSVDCITMLAVFEHVHDPGLTARECYRVLAPGGRIVLTVPHPFVDKILDLIVFLRLADGMAHEEHHGFDVDETVPIFEAAGFELEAVRPFQLGLNRLFVFRKEGAGSEASPVPGG